MRTYPRYLEEAGIHNSGETLGDKIEEAIAQTGFEIFTSVGIMAGIFGCLSMLSGIFNNGLSQTFRAIFNAITGI